MTLTEVMTKTFTLEKPVQYRILQMKVGDSVKYSIEAQIIHPATFLRRAKSYWVPVGTALSTRKYFETEKEAEQAINNDRVEWQMISPEWEVVKYHSGPV